MSAYATIILELHKCGIVFQCDECNIEEFIPVGDVDRLLEQLNLVEDICNPDSVFRLTEKGGKTLEEEE